MYVDKDKLSSFLLNLRNQLLNQASMASPSDVAVQLYAKASAFGYLFDLIVDEQFDIGEEITMQ